MRAAIAMLVLVGLVGCDAPPAVNSEPVAKSEPAVKSEPVVRPDVPVQPVETPTPEPPVVAEVPLPGVGPGGAEGRAARRDAVLAVLGTARARRN
jgi:hypothetical protein